MDGVRDPLATVSGRWSARRESDVDRVSSQCELTFHTFLSGAEESAQAGATIVCVCIAPC